MPRFWRQVIPLDWSMITMTEVVLFIAGIVAGFVSAVAGGSNVITFPTLQWAGIQSAIVTTATTTVALIPGNALAAYKDGSKCPTLDLAFLVLLVSAAIWSVAGAQLLLLTPEWLFRLLVPALLGGATLLFAFSKTVSVWLKQVLDQVAQTFSTEISPAAIRALLYIPIAIYGGFFGAGLGILVLAVLSIGENDERAANAAKNVINAVGTSSAAAFYIWQGAVSWPQALWMLPGVAIGGFLGGWFSQTMPKEKLRTTVIAIGTIVSLEYARRYWT